MAMTMTHTMIWLRRLFLISDSLRFGAHDGSHMNWRTLGWARLLQGLREGNQQVLLTGFALLAWERLRSKPKRKLLYRKTLPIGSSVVVRHTKRGHPRLEIDKPGRQTR